MAKTKELQIVNGGNSHNDKKHTEQKVIKNIYVYKNGKCLEVTKTKKNKTDVHEIRIPTAYHAFLDHEEFPKLIGDIIKGNMPNQEYHKKIKSENREAYEKLVNRCGFATEKFGFKKSPAKKKEKIPYKREKISQRRISID